MSQIANDRVAHFARRYGLLFLADIAAWGIGILAALVLRFDFNFSRIHWGWTLALIAVTALLQLAAGWITWLYRGRYETGGFDEVRALVFDVIAVMVVAWIFAYLLGYGAGIPRSTMIIAAPITFSLMAAARYIMRLANEQRMKPGLEAERALLYGAGYLGNQTVKRLLTDPHSPAEYRCNGIVRNMPAFVEAYGVKAGDALYLPPEQVVRIW